MVASASLLASSRFELCDDDGVSEIKCSQRISATVTVQNAQVRRADTDSSIVL